ncbi:glucose dehydrogenase [FAD, quinone] [Nasonia vitripennis]|uniref:Glucose-methanol-choline oxidoreductase N-terminal domain-containing protein n=1 Tax=Nasonia vitripennis TaxID=7425 RepID=A0A7M7J1W2_NASVI|nr:glucose dehydrogenase [FAD, quinone] [Nasonia vitripennis]
MARIPSLLVTTLVTLTCATNIERNTVYHNLYGFLEEEKPFQQTALNLGYGGLHFLAEGEEFLANQLKDKTPKFGEEYDFLVVGAGSAGATIASRLSETKNFKVLLIEAGGYENLIMDIPVIVNYLQFSNDINWKYQTEPSESYCRGLRDRKCNWPRGKVMGGSSVLNYMIATRGNPLDYDKWAEMGNEGWSYAEIFKYFKKLESIQIPELRDEEKMHNVDGPMRISYPPYHTPLAESFIKAGLEMGYPTIDYNANQNVGFSYIQATIMNGTRFSTNRGYLQFPNRRQNLFLSMFSHVNKVLIDSKTKRALGVEFTKSNRTIRVRARKEVILSAGAINSPQILMLSGIGPVKHLEEININVIQDLPVGENLMDHIAYGGLIFLVDQPVSIATRDLMNPINPYLNDFLIKKVGPLTVPGACEALAFIDVDNPNKLDAYPNMELLFTGASIVSDYALRYTVGYSDEPWNKMFAPIFGNYSWMIFPMLMQPKSRGRILLRSQEPMAKPRIIANYYDDPEDVRISIKGIRAAIEVSKTKSMQKFNSRIHDVLVPGCEDHEYDSDDYWECALRTFTFTIYHYSGTCKMAPENDPTSVVNPRLQVKGIKGLRVADASIMPSIITGHTNIPTIMIGEKVADMIKEDWKKN